MIAHVCAHASGGPQMAEMTAAKQMRLTARDRRRQKQRPSSQKPEWHNEAPGGTSAGGTTLAVRSPKRMGPIRQQDATYSMPTTSSVAVQACAVPNGSWTCVGFSRGLRGRRLPPKKRPVAQHLLLARPRVTQSSRNDFSRNGPLELEQSPGKGLYNSVPF